jgi:hypothetical protein
LRKAAEHSCHAEVQDQQQRFGIPCHHCAVRTDVLLHLIKRAQRLERAAQQRLILADAGALRLCIGCIGIASSCIGNGSGCLANVEPFANICLILPV